MQRCLERERGHLSWKNSMILQANNAYHLLVGLAKMSRKRERSPELEEFDDFASQ